MNPCSEQISDALRRLDAWIEREAFKGWGVYDALNSRLLKRLTFGNRLLGIAWVQLFKRSPVNFRPLLGIPRGYNPKGMGLFLASYLRKHQMTGAKQYLDRVNFFSNWLQENVSTGYSGACWGYNFDWPNRGFFAPAGTPTVVNTAFIGLAFLDAYRVLNIRSASSGQNIAAENANFSSPSVARSACDFLLNDLNRVQPDSGELCFSYTPLDRRMVHNANLMGALLLAETYAHTGESRLAETACAAARYTAHCQRADGSWPYGEGRTDGWVDNFHTGFVLVALKHIATRLETAEFNDVIDAGYRFWKEHLFLPDGTPKYYPESVYPIDAHCVAQAILTFLEFADQDSEAKARAQRVAYWGIKHMQDSEGYFYYQIHRCYRIRIPYMRWSQAWMQRALTELLWVVENS